MLVLMGEPGTFASTVGRLAVLTAAYTLYFVAFLGICLAVSAHARLPRTALLTLLCFWIVNSLVAPRAATDIARRVYPTPSAFEFAALVQHDLQGGESAKELQARVLKQYGVDNVGKLPVSFRGISLAAGEEHGDAVFDKRYGEVLGCIRPPGQPSTGGGNLCADAGDPVDFDGLAGTDFAQHRHFAVAAEDYRRQFIRAINDDITKNSAGQDVYLRGNDLWQSIPEFTYVAPDMQWVLSHQLAPLGLLTLWAIAGMAAAWWSAGRLQAI